MIIITEREEEKLGPHRNIECHRCFWVMRWVERYSIEIMVLSAALHTFSSKKVANFSQTFSIVCCCHCSKKFSHIFLLLRKERNTSMPTLLCSWIEMDYLVVNAASFLSILGRKHSEMWKYIIKNASSRRCSSRR